MAEKMFISYSTKDIEFIRAIEDLIATKYLGKITPVVSADEKMPGSAISDKIIGHIQDCRIFLILITENSKTNPTVMNELGFANALYYMGSIDVIIPIIERYYDSEGKDIFIDTGAFFNKNIDSAFYYPDKDKWKECLQNIDSYIYNAFQHITKPEFQQLIEKASRLSYTGNNWEAGENYRIAADSLFKVSKFDEAIDAIKKSINEYRKNESFWEAHVQYSKLAKHCEKVNNYHEAIAYYISRGELLENHKEDYSWELAKSYENAGRLYKKIKDTKNSVKYYNKAKDIYKEDGYNDESDRIEEIL